MNPFGMAACEAEIMQMGPAKYSDLYFDETPFNETAQLDETYLVVGRRGFGKTALAQAFSFTMRDRAPSVSRCDDQKTINEFWLPFPGARRKIAKSQSTNSAKSGNSLFGN